MDEEKTATQRVLRLGTGLGFYLGWLLGALGILWLGLEHIDKQANPYDRDALLMATLGGVVLFALLAQLAAERWRHPLSGVMMRLTIFGYLVWVLVNSVT